MTFTTDPNTGLLQINVNASTTVNTFFARIVPSLSTLAVSDTAQTTRANVLMTLVLDRSGSMLNNGGAQALPIAVQYFLTYFSDTLDQVAVASFASNATLDHAMGYNFTSSIDSIVGGNFSADGGFGGATYALGGMLLAQGQESANPPNVQKVVVFFTDGIANTIEDNLSCPGYPLINYGGNAPSEGNGVWFMDPAPATQTASSRAEVHPVAATRRGDFHRNNMGRWSRSPLLTSRIKPSIACCKWRTPCAPPILRS